MNINTLIFVITFFFICPLNNYLSKEFYLRNGIILLFIITVEIQNNNIGILY